MTLEQKMDLMLEQMQDLREDVGDLKEEMQQLSGRVGRVEDNVGLVKLDVSALRSGQAQMRKELHTVSGQVEVTYNLALENWGQIKESKVRLSMLEG